MGAQNDAIPSVNFNSLNLKKINKNLDLETRLYLYKLLFSGEKY